MDREALLTERKALVERIEVLTPLLADISQPPGKITGGCSLRPRRRDRQARRSLGVADSGLHGRHHDPVGSEQRREAVERKWEALDMDRCRMLVDELTVTIEPISPGHVKFDPASSDRTAATDSRPDSSLQW